MSPTTKQHDVDQPNWVEDIVTSADTGLAVAEESSLQQQIKQLQQTIDDYHQRERLQQETLHHLDDQLKRFVERDTLTLGICNGFQILTQVGLLPGALIHNKSFLPFFLPFLPCLPFIKNL